MLSFIRGKLTVHLLWNFIFKVFRLDYFLVRFGQPACTRMGYNSLQFTVPARLWIQDSRRDYCRREDGKLWPGSGVYMPLQVICTKTQPVSGLHDTILSEDAYLIM